MHTLDLYRRDDKQLAAYRAACTLKTCPIKQSYYAYRPSLPANAVFLALFSFSLCCFILQAALSRRFIGFTAAMVSGCSLEVLGYIGRIMSWYNPFHQTGFLMQIVCLTIAPAFLAAGIYLTLSRIVITFGPENSHIKPLSYPRIFIPCDVISLLLQAIGGGMASVASHQGKSPNTGDHIMVAGLGFQVITLLLFQLLCVDFTIKTLRRMKAMGDAALDPKHAALRGSTKFRIFLVALALATLCIFIRSIYRVAELSEGWTGALIQEQHLFIGFEGAMVVVAVLVLNLFHPGYCFREGYVQKKYRNLFRKKEEMNVDVGDEKGSPVPNASSEAATPVRDMAEKDNPIQDASSEAVTPVRDTAEKGSPIQNASSGAATPNQNIAEKDNPIQNASSESATPIRDIAEKGSPVPNASSKAATPVRDIEEDGADVKES